MSRQAGRAARPWVERLARLGYAAKGIVYLVLGWLAFQAAQGAGDPHVDKGRVLANILGQPFGRFLLGIVAVGLAGYALWRLVEAALDPEGDGKRSNGLIKRLGWAVAGVSYAGLAVAAAQLTLNPARPSAGGAAAGNPRDLTARLMAQPLGRWLVGLAGLVVLVVAFVYFYQAVTAGFERRFKSGELKGEQRKWVLRIGRFGYAAQGVVYLVVGGFLVQAAWQYNPQKAGGLGDALAALAAQPFGTYLLALVAAGLLAYGLYALFLAQYRRIYVRL
jgi:hypothetical protein